MQEFSVYSVIPPEGCAAILWRDAEAQGRGRRSAQDHGAGPAALGIIDEIVKEPIGGAHQDYAQAATLADKAIVRHLAELQALSSADRLERRYQKFRSMGTAPAGPSWTTEPR